MITNDRNIVADQYVEEIFKEVHWCRKSGYPISPCCPTQHLNCVLSAC